MLHGHHLSELNEDVTNLHEDIADVENTEACLVLRLAQIQVVFQTSKLCCGNIVSA
jgi:hypothetical protein